MASRLTISWVRGPADEAAVDEGCTFDLKAADRVRKFFATFLRQSKGQWAGKPLELLDWQWQDLIAPLFGWKRPDGTRRFRRAYVEIPKKNGKSTLASGVGLYLLMGDGEPGAEVYSLGGDRDQAGIVHGEAVRMVQASPGLSAYLAVNLSTKNILFGRANSWYRALSAEAHTKEGLNAHGLIADELHAWYGRVLWDTVRYAGASRRQPLLFAITTAGDDMQSVCREQHDYAKAVLRGTVKDSRFFAYVRAARSAAEGDAEDDDWTAEETWRRANPSLGVTIPLDDFRADCEEARASPSLQSSFKRYRLDVWSTATTPWLRPEDWAACRREYAEADLEGQPCWGGLDLASVHDLTAFVLAFPDGEDAYRLLAWFWLPEATVNDPDAPEQYRVWARQRLLRTTPGNVCDYDFVKRDVKALAQRFVIRDYAFDPWNAEQVTQQLEAEAGLKRVSFGQTITNFAEPTKECERLVRSGRLRHDGNPVLAWQAGHVQVRSDSNNNRRPVKPPNHDRRKVDGIVAAVMALGRAMQGNKGQSFYSDRGLEFA